MLTKIDLCSMALLKIGEKPIQSFTEDTAAAALARTLFDTVSDSLLSVHPWRFAMKKFNLTKTTDGDFLIPTEVLRVLNCDATRYDIRGNRLMAAADAISVDTIARVGVESYPSYFVTAAATRLAMEFCMPLTDNQNTFNTLAALYESELRAAKFVDSTMASTNDIANFSLISARF